MAPFPEDEIMTIKRLEVALKKSDFKLLKEGAYKLHEKYHSHYHFEYLDLLKIILDEVEANYAVPPDIKDILIPTIKDILSQDNEQTNRISSLTSLSYGVHNNSNNSPQVEIKKPEFERIERPQAEQEYIKPFQEFTPIKPIEVVPNNETEKTDGYVTNLSSIARDYDAKPTDDMILDEPVFQQNIFENRVEQKPVEYLSGEERVEIEQDNTFQEIKEPVEYLSSGEENKAIEEKSEVLYKEENIEEIKEPVEYSSNKEESTTIEEDITQEVEQTIEEIEPIQEVQEIDSQEIEKEIKEIEPIQKIEEIEPQEVDEIVTEEIEEQKEPKSIAIFYGQDSSNEKIRNITKYRELIYNQKDFSLNEIINLINEIKMQADTNVAELQFIFEKLKSTPNHINFITSSQSANLIDLLNQTDITYSIFNNSEDKRINLLPLMGLTNLFVCKDCKEEYLDANEKVNPFILQCPKCKGAMLPNLYAVKGEIDMNYYNSSIIALANSDIWLLIHPSLNEKLTLDMIRSALKVSSKVKEIYILDKDINVRETYKKLFEDINPNVKVNNGLNVLEEFFTNI